MKRAWEKEFYGNGSTYIEACMSKDNYKRFVLGYKSIGRPGEKGGMFVYSQNVSKEMVTKLTSGSVTNQTPQFKIDMAIELGLPQDAFESGVVKLKIPIVDNNKPRVVKGIEEGCNDQWIPGGKTLGGTYEAMIDQITEVDNPDLYKWIIENVEGY